MNKRNLVKELIVSYMNMRRIKFVSIKDFKKEYKDRIPKDIDIYWLTYNIGLNDKGFSIEKDGVDTFIRMI